MCLPGVLINTWQTIASVASVGWISAAHPPFAVVMVDALHLSTLARCFSAICGCGSITSLTGLLPDWQPSNSTDQA
jgi:hypothetical protein